ncbi:MAG: hypothetical protein KAT38_02795 [Bacteroidales bacterium]|nr:hypothetical protein [Bacteroidales bacterium]
MMKKFESSGNFTEATCHFINSEILFLKWHDTSIVQTFTKDGTNRVILRMEHSNTHGKNELIMEVIFTRK